MIVTERTYEVVEVSRYIFLDIDGVLNSKRTKARGPYDNLGIGKKQLDILKTIVDKTNGEIVIISDWRLSFLPDDHMPEMADYIIRKLNEAELSFAIVSEKNHYENRIDEITEWIKNNPTDGYIILDDNHWPGYETEIVKPHWIQTDPDKGLEEKHIEEAVTSMSVPVKQISGFAASEIYNDDKSTDDKKIDDVAKLILEKHIEAFKELAKQ